MSQLSLALETQPTLLDVAGDALTVSAETLAVGAREERIREAVHQALETCQRAADAASDTARRRMEQCASVISERREAVASDPLDRVVALALTQSCREQMDAEEAWYRALRYASGAQAMAAAVREALLTGTPAEPREEGDL
jgi:hypothetical protein